MEQLVQTIQDQSESGEFDELNDIMGDLGVRAQEWFWKENDAGVIFVGDSARQPEVVARVELSDGDLSAERVENTSELDWNQLQTVSEPDSAVRDRQFD